MPYIIVKPDQSKIKLPELGESDELLAKALDLKFNGPWHFSIQQNLFRTSGKTVENIKKTKHK